MKIFFIQQMQKHVSEHKAAYFCAVLFFTLGISCGIFYYKYIGDYFNDHFGRYMESYLTYLANGSNDRKGLFFTSYLSTAKTLLFLFLSGIVPATLPITYLIIGGRGFVFGFSAAMLFNVLNFSGFIIFLFGLLPQCLLILPVYLFCTVVCTIKAKNKIMRIKQLKYRNINEDVAYTKMFLCALAASALSSIYITLIMPLIMNGIFQLFKNMI